MKTMKSNLFKWMLALVAVTAVLGALSTFAFNKSLEENPEILENVETTLRQHFNNENIHIDFEFEDESEKVSSVLTFDLPLSQLTVGTTSGSIELTTNPVATKVTITTLGSKKKLETAKTTSPDSLSFGKASVTIEVPENFTAPVLLKTVSGDISVNGLNSETFEAVSVSGEVELSNTVVKKTVVHSVSGDIEVQQKTAGELNVNSISGEVELQLAAATEGYQFDLKSVSGNVTNHLKNATAGKLPVVVTTTSGNIEIR